ncbi:RRP4 [Sanghuangporus vaninii]
MITITSFPTESKDIDTYERTRHHPDVEDDVLMDEFDEEDSMDTRLTSPGVPLTSSRAFMRGHGTYVDGDEVIASVAGTIERVNKLLTIRDDSTVPIMVLIRLTKTFSTVQTNRYNPEVGDLVVGRITEVAARRWKVDANARQDAVLMLSSVNLPGGIQRRKLESDELQMRNFFEEGDLLVAEVQAFFADGAMSLHTRSLKYGKLRNGQLITVPPILIRRLKSHFISLPCGVDLILGLNGYVWVSKHVREREREGEEGFDAEAVYSSRNDDIDYATRIAIARVSNILRVLATYFVPVTDTILADAYEWSLEQDPECGVEDLLREENAEAMVLAVTARAAG